VGSEAAIDAVVEVVSPRHDVNGPVGEGIL